MVTPNQLSPIPRSPFSTPLGAAELSRPPAAFVPAAGPDRCDAPDAERPAPPVSEVVVAAQGAVAAPVAAQETGAAKTLGPAPELSAADVYARMRARLDGQVPVTDVNGFGVVVMDLRASGPEARALALAAEAEEKAPSCVFVLPDDAALPPELEGRFRRLVPANKIDVAPLTASGEAPTQDDVAAVEAITAGAAGAWTWVRSDARIPHILNGERKAAAHVTVAVTVQMAASQAEALEPVSDLPALLALPQAAAGEPLVEVGMMLAGMSGASATFAKYANTFTGFGGSADIYRATLAPNPDWLEPRALCMIREAGEEAGITELLLGRVRLEPVEQRTKVALGGRLSATVDDGYMSGVSERTLTLEQLQELCKNAKADGREFTHLALLRLPTELPTRAELQAAVGPEATPKEAKKAMKGKLKEHLMQTWWPVPADLAGKERKTAERSQAGAVRMAMAVLTSRGLLGDEAFPLELDVPALRARAARALDERSADWAQPDPSALDTPSGGSALNGEDEAYVSFMLKLCRDRAVDAASSAESRHWTSRADVVELALATLPRTEDWQPRRAQA